MPVGWPLHLDGAVKQWCVHRTATFQELADLLSTYDIEKRPPRTQLQSCTMDMRSSMESLVYGCQARQRLAPNVARPRNRHCQTGNQLTGCHVQRPTSRSDSSCQPTSRPATGKHLSTSAWNPRHPYCPTTNWIISTESYGGMGEKYL